MCFIFKIFDHFRTFNVVEYEKAPHGNVGAFSIVLA